MSSGSLDLDSGCALYLRLQHHAFPQAQVPREANLSEEQNIRRVAVFYHPRLPAARVLADDLLDILGKTGVRGWARSAWDEEITSDNVGDRDLLISVGGDGTMLRVSHLALALRDPRPWHQHG